MTIKAWLRDEAKTSLVYADQFNMIADKFDDLQIENKRLRGTLEDTRVFILSEFPDKGEWPLIKFKIHKALRAINDG